VREPEAAGGSDAVGERIGELFADEARRGVAVRVVVTVARAGRRPSWDASSRTNVCSKPNAAS